MSNYFEKYIKYKKKYSLINLKSSGGSHSAVENQGLLIAQKIQQLFKNEINLFTEPNDSLNKRLTELLTVDKIIAIANIRKLVVPQMDIKIARHVLLFLIEPKEYYKVILD